MELGVVEKYLAHKEFKSNKLHNFIFYLVIREIVNDGPF